MPTCPLSPRILIQAHLIYLNAHCFRLHLNSHNDPTSSPLGLAHTVPLNAYLAQLTAHSSSLGPIRFHFIPNCSNSFLSAIDAHLVLRGSNWTSLIWDANLIPMDHPCCPWVFIWSPPGPIRCNVMPTFFKLSCPFGLINGR